MSDQLDEAQTLDEREREAIIARSRRPPGGIAHRPGVLRHCEDCGRAIPPERIAALPEALRCIDCQEAFEARACR